MYHGVAQPSLAVAPRAHNQHLSTAASGSCVLNDGLEILDCGAHIVASIWACKLCLLFRYVWRRKYQRVIR